MIMTMLMMMTTTLTMKAQRKRTIKLPTPIKKKTAAVTKIADTKDRGDIIEAQIDGGRKGEGRRDRQTTASQTDRQRRGPS